LALYNLSYNVATTPTAYVAEQAGEALLPGLSALTDPSRRRQAFLRALGLAILIVTPLVFGLAAVSSTMVAALLDKRWAGAAPMITILSGVGGGYMISCVTSPFLLSYRRAGTVLALAWVRTISMVVLMTTVGRAGPLWAATSASAAVALAMLVSLIVISRSEEVRLGAMIQEAAPALGAALVMGVGVAAARALWSKWGASVALGLVLEVGFGALCYLVAAAVLARRQVRDLAGIARELRGRSFPGTR
jgi:O-antigen/teichoic acid export membrane protein